MQGTSSTQPVLHQLCVQMMYEIRALSGLPSQRLAGTSFDLQEVYERWCSQYEQSGLADSFMGFREMLLCWPLPWNSERDSLKDLSLSQLFFARAYHNFLSCLALLEAIDEGDSSITVDEVSCFAVLGTKSLMHAKSLLITAPAAGDLP